MKNLHEILKKENYRKVKFKITKTQHLLIKAKINGVTGNFILDTGASSSCVGFESVELFLFTGLIALITMVINKKGQRLGDIVANTCLIDLNPKLDLSQTIFAEVSETYKIRFPEVYRLSDRDINIVKENFTSALHNNNYDILLKLTRKLEEIMEVKSDGLGNIDFIQVVIQDHYHYHKDK